MAVSIRTPLTPAVARTLKSGDSVLISGVIYTARDAAHKRLCELVAQGKPLPMDVRNAIIYFVGPTPAKPGQAIGSAGPTTSYRMDAYSPTLIAQGLTGMIGKGKRGPEVVAAMKEHGAVYFGAIGGAGALLSNCVKKAEIIAYEDLGAEAIRRLEVEDLPVTVIIDCEGRSFGISLSADAVPVRPEVNAACELLGLDPLYCANEGKMLCIAAPEKEQAILEALRRTPGGSEAACIGEVTADWPGKVVLHTAFGGSRVLSKLAGAQLPRIC